MEKNIKLNLKTQTIKPYKTNSSPISESTYDSSQFKNFLDVYFKLKITPSALKRI
jgi:hypothetical protein